MKVVTHNGTGLDAVNRVFSALGHELEVIESRQDAYHVDMDRLILLGGSDISPNYYGQENRLSQQSNTLRDQIEWALVRRAIIEDVPILGIFRGHQLLAVAEGGTLFQDINIQKNGRINKVYHSYSQHKIKAVKSPLSDFIFTDWVNSLHHQAVKVVPHGYRVTALSSDNVIESIYNRKGRLGVQFHPELLVDDDHRWIHLFIWLIEGLKQ